MKKLTINTVAFSNLKNRKKQYATMIIGIILAMMFSSSVIFFLFSMYSSYNYASAEAYGKQNVTFFNVNDDIINDGIDKDFIEDYGYAHTIGFGYTDKDNKKYGVGIAWLDDNAKNISNVSLIEGRYPTSNNEIAIEKTSLLKLDANAKIGDTISLTVDVQNAGAYLPKSVKKSYKLVGILKNKRSNITNKSETDAHLLSSAFVCSKANTEIGGKERLDSYIVLNNYRMNEKEYSDYSAYLSSHSITYDSQLNDFDKVSRCLIINDDYGIDYGIQSGMYDDLIMPLVFTIILVFVLLLASCLGVVNAFGANLRERKKQIGMLRAVGATKRQIVSVYGRETLIISVIASPVSVLLSYFLVKAITLIMGDNFIFAPKVWIIVVSLIVSVVFVMLAAAIPLLSASRIAPMQAIRNIDIARKMKHKNIKSRHSYNLSALIAKRSMTFNKSRKVIVTIILVVTIVVSCFGIAAVQYGSDNLNNFYDYDYSVRITTETIYSDYINYSDKKYGYNDNDRQDIINNPYVKNTCSYKQCHAGILVDKFSDYLKIESMSNANNMYTDNVPTTKEEFDKSFENDFSDDYLNMLKTYGYSKNFIPVDIGAIDNDILLSLSSSVTEGKIDIDKLNSGEEIIMVAPKTAAVCYSSDGNWSLGAINANTKDDEIVAKAERDYKVGDKIELSVLNSDKYVENDISGAKRTDKTVTIGAIIEEIPYSLMSIMWNGDDFVMLTTLDGIKAYNSDLAYRNISISIDGECTKEIDDSIMPLLNDIVSKSSTGTAYSYYQWKGDQEQYYDSFLVAILAVLILFFAISGSIINNSLTSNIRENVKELGTLRAVGASERELVFSYIRQLLSTFIWGYSIGFVIYIIAYFIYYDVCKYKNVAFELSFNPWITLCACIILFLFCSLNLWAKIRKEMKKSIVDNIREL